MMLKNKKTGEIIEAIIVDHGAEWEICNMYTNEEAQIYDSLAKLNEEWEDAPEEPKGIQCIYYVNHFDAAKLDGVIVGFATKEEAEKAVEKLKALTRLEKKGFRFEGYILESGHNKIIFDMFLENKESLEKAKPDLDLLFGGEG